MQSTSSRLAVRSLAGGGRPGSGSLVCPPMARSRRAVSNIAGPAAIASVITEWREER